MPVLYRVYVNGIDESNYRYRFWTNASAEITAWRNLLRGWTYYEIGEVTYELNSGLCLEYPDKCYVGDGKDDPTTLCGGTEWAEKTSRAITKRVTALDPASIPGYPNGDPDLSGIQTNEDLGIYVWEYERNYRLQNAQNKSGPNQVLVRDPVGNTTEFMYWNNSNVEAGRQVLGGYDFTIGGSTFAGKCSSLVGNCDCTPQFKTTDTAPGSWPVGLLCREIQYAGDGEDGGGDVRAFTDYQWEQTGGSSFDPLLIRKRATKTYYHESGAQFKHHRVYFSDADEFGHYSNETHTADIPPVSSNERIYYRDYENKTAGQWILGLLTAEEIRDLAGAPDSRTTYEYNANGHLWKQIDACVSSPPQCTVKTRELLYVSGNLDTETISDDGTETRSYKVKYEWQNGALQSKRYLETIPGEGDPNWYIEYHDLDANSGLPTKSYFGRAVTTGAYNYSLAFSYDAFNRPITVVRDRPVLTVTLARALQTPSGELITASTSASGKQKIINWTQFDGLGRTVENGSNIEPGTAIQAYKYDGKNRKIKESQWRDGATNPWASDVVHYSYDSGTGTDPLGRLQETNIDGTQLLETRAYTGTWSETVTQYDVGCEETVPNCDDAVTTLERDAFGNIVAVTDSNGTKASYTYDPLDKLTQVAIDPLPTGNPQERSFVYDSQGRLMQEEHPEWYGCPGSNPSCGSAEQEQGVVVYGPYDGLGNLAKRVEKNKDETPLEQTVFTRSYDAAGRQLDLKVDDVVVDQFTYDEANRGYSRSKLTTEISYSDDGLTINSTKEYSFDFVIDPFNNVSQVKVDEYVYGYGPFTHEYDYDLHGALSKITYPRLAGEPARMVDVSYERGYMHMVSDGSRTYADAALYHRNGLLGYVQRNTVSLNTLVDVDSRNRLDRIRHDFVTGPTFDTGDYKYSDSGNIVGIGSDSFTYDKLSRLTSSSIQPKDPTPVPVGPYDGAYQYDGFGNHTDLDEEGRGFANRTYDRNQIDDPNYSYDERGNLVKIAGDPTTTFWFDDRNRMEQYAIWGMDPFFVAEYFYDSSGRRVLSTAQSHLPGSCEGQGIKNGTVYIRGLDGKVLSEYDVDCDVINWKKDYIYFNGTTSAVVKSDGSGGEEVRFLFKDHLGTTRVATDENGAPLAYHEMMPFGYQVNSDAPDGYTHLFTDHERDATGLDYMMARYYDGAQGRFISTDPKGGDTGNIQSWNRYAYVLNRPLSFADPDGLAPESGIKLIWSRRTWKHVFNRHVRSDVERDATKFTREVAEKNQLKRLAEETRLRPDRVRHQKDGRYVFGKDFQAPIGEGGETTARLVTKPIREGEEAVRTFHAIDSLAQLLAPPVIVGYVEAMKAMVGLGVKAGEHLQATLDQGGIGEHNAQLEAVLEDEDYN